MVEIVLVKVNIQKVVGDRIERNKEEYHQRKDEQEEKCNQNLADEYRFIDLSLLDQFGLLDNDSNVLNEFFVQHYVIIRIVYSHTQCIVYLIRLKMCERRFRRMIQIETFI